MERNQKFDELKPYNLKTKIFACVLVRVLRLVPRMRERYKDQIEDLRDALDAANFAIAKLARKNKDLKTKLEQLEKK
jgi:hypothetical protein